MTIIAQDDFAGPAGPLLGRVAPVGGVWGSPLTASGGAFGWPPPLVDMDGAGSIFQTNLAEDAGMISLPVEFIGDTGYIEITVTPAATVLGGILVIYAYSETMQHELWLISSAAGEITRQLRRNSLDTDDVPVGVGAFEETLSLPLGVPCTFRMDMSIDAVTLYVNGTVNAVREDPASTALSTKGLRFAIYLEAAAKMDGITVFDSGAAAGPEQLHFWTNLVGVTQA